MTVNVKGQVLKVSQDYLGPSAERFIDRQIATHLDKKPTVLTTEELLKLLDWLRLSFALLTDDTQLVNEYIGRLKLVARGKPAQALGKQWSPK